MFELMVDGSIVPAPDAATIQAFLKQGKIDGETPIRKKGSEKWSRVKRLKTNSKSQDTRASTQAGVIHDASRDYRGEESAPSLPHEMSRTKSWTSTRFLIVIGGVIFLASVITVAIRFRGTSTTNAVPNPELADNKGEPAAEGKEEKIDKEPIPTFARSAVPSVPSSIETNIATDTLTRASATGDLFALTSDLTGIVRVDPESGEVIVIAKLPQRKIAPSQVGVTDLAFKWYNELDSLQRSLHVSPNGATLAVDDWSATYVVSAEKGIVFTATAEIDELGVVHTTGPSGYIPGKVIAVSNQFILTSEGTEFEPAGVGVYGIDGTIPARRFQGHKKRVLFAEFDLDGRHVITGGDDRIAVVWDTDTGQEKGILDAHIAGVCSGAFSRNGMFIVTAGIDGTVILWDRRGLKLHSTQIHDYLPAKFIGTYSAQKFDQISGRNPWPLDLIRSVDVSVDGRWALISLLQADGTSLRSCHYLVDAPAEKKISLMDEINGLPVRTFFSKDDPYKYVGMSIDEKRERGESHRFARLNTFSLRLGSFADR